jgi:thiamine-phosphate pyrophosphorylase
MHSFSARREELLILLNLTCSIAMRLLTLPPIYPITDRIVSGLSHVEQVRQLIAAGAGFIQLREKHLSPREFYEEAREAIEYAHAHGARIIINDRVDIAAAIGADGVHLGQTDMPAEAARAFLGANAIIGYSTHSVEQAAEAASFPIDYLAIGPVFDTSTKTDPDPVVGLEGVTAVRSKIGSIPLVAIGGIDAESLPAVLQAGATSAAIISGVLKGDIVANLTLMNNAASNQTR